MHPDRFPNSPRFRQPPEESSASRVTIPETLPNVDEALYDRILLLHEELRDLQEKKKNSEALLKSIEETIALAQNTLDGSRKNKDAILRSEVADEKISELAEIQQKIEAGLEKIAELQDIVNNIRIQSELISSRIRHITERSKNVSSTISGDPELN